MFFFFFLSPLHTVGAHLGPSFLDLTGFIMIFLTSGSSQFVLLARVQSADFKNRMAHAGPLRCVAGRFYKTHPSEAQSPSIDFPLGRFCYPIWPYCFGDFGLSVSPADGGRIKRIHSVIAAADETF